MWGFYVILHCVIPGALHPIVEQHNIACYRKSKYKDVQHTPRGDLNQLSSYKLDITLSHPIVIKWICETYKDERGCMQNEALPQTQQNGCLVLLNTRRRDRRTQVSPDGLKSSYIWYVVFCTNEHQLMINDEHISIKRRRVVHSTSFYTIPTTIICLIRKSRYYGYFRITMTPKQNGRHFQTSFSDAFFSMKIGVFGSKLCALWFNWQ